MMPVEILILSGSRQGQRLLIDAEEFRAGGDCDCELFFDPACDAGARDRCIRFGLRDDGWWALDSRGSDLRINRQRVAGPMRIRSGNVVRMSDRGPEFSFSLVARAATAEPPAFPSPASGLAPMENVAPWGGGKEPVDDRPAPVAASFAGQGDNLEPSAAVGVPPGSPLAPPAQPVLPTNRVIPEEESAPGRPLNQPRVGLAAVPQPVMWGAVALVVIVVLVLLTRPRVIVVTEASKPAAATAAVDAAAPKDKNAEETAAIGAAAGDKDVAATKAAAMESPQHEQEAAKGPQESDKVKQETAKADPAVMAQAVYLIQVQKGPVFFPFATCCAVGEDTVLTTAREAIQLARWRADQNQPFRFWVTNTAQHVKREILDIRVHAVFAALADKPDDWIYYDLALLTIEGKLPHVAQVAPLAQTALLEEGVPVTCCGYIHSGDKITRNDKLEPVATEGKLFIVTHRPDLPSDPRLLHVKARFGKVDPPNTFGAPLFDGQGKVVAIYGEKASSPDKAEGQPDLNLHYAPVVSAELIDLWTTKRDEKIWMPPPRSLLPLTSPVDRRS